MASILKKPVASFKSLLHSLAGYFGVEIVPTVDIYVKNTGDDLTGNGTKEKPYRTNAKAFSVAVAGQTIYCYSGWYTETQQWNVKDGVNWIGAGNDPKTGTVIVCAYSTPYSGDPINWAWVRCVSSSYTRETLGNNFRKALYIGALNQQAGHFFICNRDNVTFNDINAKDFYANFAVVQARKDYSVMAPDKIDLITVSPPNTTKTYPYLTGLKFINVDLDNCSCWVPSFPNEGWKQGTDNRGYGTGAIAYGGVDGIEFVGKITNNKRGYYQEGYTLKGRSGGHNKNDNIHHSIFTRSQYNQYYNGLNIENWGFYGGAKYSHCTFNGGGVDLNNGEAGMATNPTSTYSARFEYCDFIADNSVGTPYQTFNTDGSVAGTYNSPNVAITIEAITSYRPNFQDFTASFVNANTFTVTGNQTGNLNVGKRVKIQVTAGALYGNIATSVYTTLTTCTVTLDSGVLDSGLSTVSYVNNPVIFEGENSITDVEIEFCKFKNYKQAYYTILHDGLARVRRIKAKNNLFINSGRGGIHTENSAAATDAIVDTILDHHNTSYNTSSELIDGYSMDIGGQVSNVTLKNNIHVGFTRSPIFSWVERAGSTLNTLTQTSNLYWNCGNGNVLDATAAGAALTNSTASNLTPANPNFVNAAAEDFHLTANIAGVNSGVPTDYDGVTRNATTPTVGAFEHA